MEYIELIKCDLESVLVNLESTHVRIGRGFSIIVAFFYVVFPVFCVLRRQVAVGEKGNKRNR